VRHTLGTSLWAVRLLPALAGAATVALVGWMTRRLGGGRLAQALSLSCALIAGQYLAFNHFYSMNAFEILAWAGAALLIRLPSEEGEAEPRPWGRPGSLWAACWHWAPPTRSASSGSALGSAPDATARRRWLATRWPWIGDRRPGPASAIRLAAPERLATREFIPMQQRK
jgi:hypothetical protein